ncbi:MAG: cell division protein FtsA [Candidatus Buchananbacteria bacterium]
MPKSHLITGLDIGSTAIRIAVGERSKNDTKIRIIGAVEGPSAGISKGVVVGSEDAISAISAVIERAERMIGQPIEHAWVGINGSHIVTTESHGVVAVSKSNGEITYSDVDRVVEAAKAVASPPNYEILHVIPKSFSVDQQVGIKDPVGMTGIRLEVDTQIIQGQSAQIKNLSNCVYRTKLNIDDLVLSILAAAECVLTAKQKEMGVAVVNLGGKTTSLAVFEEGDLLHTAVIPLGSDYITSDIALYSQISAETAEKIKVREGSCSYKEFKRQEEMKFAAVGGMEEGTFSKREIAQVISMRVEEIFEQVDRELKKIGKSGMLPAGAVVTGGGAKLDGIIEAAKKSLRLPASIGYPHDLVSALDRASDPAFTAAIGLVLWGDHLSDSGFGHVRSFSWNGPAVSGLVGKVKNIFKTLLP